MSISSDHAAKILDAISLAFPEVLQEAVDIALHRCLQVAPLVRELESHGYSVDAQVTYTVTATPVEMLFEKSLSENDIRFLRQERIGAKKAEPPADEKDSCRSVELP